jgi:hypothetical protein
MKKEIVNKKDAKILKDAYWILARHFGFPEHNCPDYAFNCFQCQVERFMRDFDSLVNFYLECDFDFSKGFKQHKPKK